MFLDHSFGENHCFDPFRPNEPPKCYTWLESYGSPLSDGKKKKIFLNPISRQNFAYAFAETPNLNLEVCHIPCVIFPWKEKVEAVMGSGLLIPSLHTMS